MENFGELKYNSPKFYPPNLTKETKPASIRTRDLATRRGERHTTVVKMAGILKFFKYKRDVSASSTPSLPEPNGSLRKKVPPKAIELANAEVTKLVGNTPRGRGPYLYLTGAQRYKVGKRAALYGTTDTMRYFAKNYPDFPELKETTVRRLKNLYKSNYCKLRHRRNRILMTVMRTRILRRSPWKLKNWLVKRPVGHC